MKFNAFLTIFLFMSVCVNAQTWTRTVSFYKEGKPDRQSIETVTDVRFKKYDPSGNCHFEFKRPNGDVTHTPLLSYASRKIAGNTTIYNWNGPVKQANMSVVTNGTSVVSFTYAEYENNIVNYRVEFRLNQTSNVQK